MRIALVAVRAAATRRIRIMAMPSLEDILKDIRKLRGCLDAANVPAYRPATTFSVAITSIRWTELADSFTDYSGLPSPCSANIRLGPLLRKRQPDNEISAREVPTTRLRAA